MKIILTILLFLGTHFNLTANVPAESKAWFLWPFDKSSKPVLSFLQNNTGTTLTQLLSIISAISFIALLFCLYGKFVPSNWWPYLLIASTSSSILLFLIHFGVYAIIPLLIDLVILYGYFSKIWNTQDL